MEFIAFSPGVIRSYVAASILVLNTGTAWSDEHDCNLVAVEGVETTQKNFDCLLSKLEQLTEENAALKQQTEAVREIMDNRTHGIGLPSGAIVAFDLPNGCPFGWTSMENEWRGRSIVAAVRNADDIYGFRRTGGEEKVKLTNANQIPNHRHTANISAGHRILQQKNFPNERSTVNTSGHDRSMEISGEVIGVNVDLSGGGDATHNNMPPYVALFLCKKE